MNRRKFFIGISGFFGFTLIAHNFYVNGFDSQYKINIIIDVLQNINFTKKKISHFTSKKNYKNNYFIQKLLLKNFKNKNELKLILKSQIIDDYKNDNIILYLNRYLSETEKKIYELKI